MPIALTMSLMPFENCAATRPFSCTAGIRLQGSLLLLTYTLSGPLQDIIIPAAAASPGFTPDLWQGTCCECFLRQDEVKSYAEWNFSPCGNWWACAFDDYRGPASRQPAAMQPRKLDIQRGKNILTLTAALACQAAPGLRIGPALILQHASGSRSHWAMEHPCGKPDFHHAETCACIV
jgi:hypothetical protein